MFQSSCRLVGSVGIIDVTKAAHPFLVFYKRNSDKVFQFARPRRKSKVWTLRDLSLVNQDASRNLSAQCNKIE
ncbi:hypothetical protein RLO149_c009690 [Roseobacter litoralis Och 149]|uniref:Uncharacterized protein n=1 Tax=Roseobacter litoralis (strain ATCC 49566 / DSM 6996 / JCM 21268 / NBRC 15278 / OCh 149) TaxID=391595 RepID=F7ZAI0_ROSLO|nr:hypothetical protein RLO149_c009690 [Roseobacter litoralis Och 149]